jgi:hypothetical protein
MQASFSVKEGDTLSQEAAELPTGSVPSVLLNIPSLFIQFVLTAVCAGFEVSTEVKVLVEVFWVTMPYSDAVGTPQNLDFYSGFC